LKEIKRCSGVKPLLRGKLNRCLNGIEPQDPTRRVGCWNLDELAFHPTAPMKNSLDKTWLRPLDNILMVIFTRSP
jgi:hypothetical protein